MLGSTGERGGGHERRRERCWGSVAAHLLEQYGRLHPAEAETAFGLGHGDGAPALLDHGTPQRRVVRRSTGEVSPHLGRARNVVQELPRRLLQRPLIGRQLEVHGR